MSKPTTQTVKFNNVRALAKPSVKGKSRRKSNPNKRSNAGKRR